MCRFIERPAGYRSLSGAPLCGEPICTTGAGENAPLARRGGFVLLGLGDARRGTEQLASAWDVRGAVIIGKQAVVRGIPTVATALWDRARLAITPMHIHRRTPRRKGDERTGRNHNRT